MELYCLSRGILHEKTCVLNILPSVLSIAIQLRYWDNNSKKSVFSNKKFFGKV